MFDVFNDWTMNYRFPKGGLLCMKELGNLEEKLKKKERTK